MEDLITTEEEELYVIIDGLEIQAEDLEDRAADIMDKAQGFGGLAVLVGGVAIALNYAPEQWPYEKQEAGALFTILAIGTAVQFIRHQAYMIKARRKYKLAGRLQEEVNSLDQLPVY